MFVAAQPANYQSTTDKRSGSKSTFHLTKALAFRTWAVSLRISALEETSELMIPSRVGEKRPKKGRFLSILMIYPKCLLTSSSTCADNASHVSFHAASHLPPRPERPEVGKQSYPKMNAFVTIDFWPLLIEKRL